MKNQKSICLIGTNKILAEKFQENGFYVNQYGRKTTPCIDFEKGEFRTKIKEIINIPLATFQSLMTTKIFCIVQL